MWHAQEAELARVLNANNKRALSDRERMPPPPPRKRAKHNNNQGSGSRSRDWEQSTHMEGKEVCAIYCMPRQEEVNGSMVDVYYLD